METEVQSQVNLNVTQTVNSHVLSRIANYLPRTISYCYASASKNASVARSFFSAGMTTTSYLVATKDGVLDFKTLPFQNKYRTEQVDLKAAKSHVISNFIFFYNEDDTTVHIYQLQPYNKTKITVAEKINSIYFHTADNDSLILIVVNGKNLYKIKDLAVIEDVPLVEGFYFYQIAYKNKLYSDFYGDVLVVQETTKAHDAYKSASLKFDTTGHFFTVGPNHVVMDFCGDLNDEEDKGDHLIKDIPQLKDKLREELANVLIKFDFVTEGIESKIKYEYVCCLPGRLEYPRVLSFSESRYMLENLEERVVSFWQKEVNIGNMQLHDEEIVNKIEVLEYPYVAAIYNKAIVVIDFTSCNIVGKFEPCVGIDKFDYLDTLTSFGNYYRCNYYLEPKEKKPDVCEQGEEKTVILSKRFAIIGEIEDKTAITAFE